MLRALVLAASAATLSLGSLTLASLSANSARADDAWRSQLEAGSFDVFHKADSEAFDLQLRPGWRLWDFGVFAGGMATTNSAFMGYLGITYDLRVTDHILILPDAAVGYYSHGRDKDLGNTAEFRTGLGVAYEFDNGWRAGLDIHHISNAGLSPKNPGVEIAALTLSIPLFAAAATSDDAAPTVSSAAAAIPGPPTPPIPNYLVFFDFNKSDLTGEARDIIRTAAEAAGKPGVTRLTVTGHTDTAGSAAYNLRLSKRRALSVEKELARDGIPSGEVEIIVKGETDLLVPTADGVREPRNRRVQIVLQ